MGRQFSTRITRVGELAWACGYCGREDLASYREAWKHNSTHCAPAMEARKQHIQQVREEEVSLARARAQAQAEAEAGTSAGVPGGAAADVAVGPPPQIPPPPRRKPNLRKRGREAWQDGKVDRVSFVKKAAVTVQRALDLDTEGLVRIHVQLRKELINLQCEEHILAEMLRRNREAQATAEAEDMLMGPL